MSWFETIGPEIGFGGDRVGDEHRSCRGEYADPRHSQIQPSHLERLAIVYVRQSTAKQVIDHRESRELQYNLRYRAEQLGWPAQRVVVIDEDQGQSGATAENRLGFQRLMAEVSLCHVGIILGWELSRLARSNKDWHQLLELCAIFDTLLADQDRLYDPADYNDRLLLGLTGIMSEAELHILRNRMMQGKRNKAQRGELFNHVPRGFVRTVSGEVRFDPDEQVQSVMRLFFARFGCPCGRRAGQIAGNFSGVILRRPSFIRSCITRSMPVRTATGGTRPTRAARFPGGQAAARGRRHWSNGRC
jgi:DNA invertase Pin-like site-specific DNA recombinase